MKLALLCLVALVAAAAAEKEYVFAEIVDDLHNPTAKAVSGGDAWATAARGRGH
jgi:hypothetical protein